MTTLFIMTGIPGAGKSTFLKKHINEFKGSSIVISRDDIRFSLVSENENYFAKEDLVYDTFINNIKEALKTYDNVFADATHLNEASRSKLLRSLGSCVDNILVNSIFIKTPLNKAIERNELRKGTRGYVPIGVIRRMNSQLTPPSTDEEFNRLYTFLPSGKIQIEINSASYVHFKKKLDEE